MTSKTKLIKKILKADVFSEDEKIELIEKVLNRETIIYPTYPIIPYHEPCTPVPPYWTCTNTSTTDVDLNVTGAAPSIICKYISS